MNLFGNIKRRLKQKYARMFLSVTLPLISFAAASDPVVSAACGPGVESGRKTRELQALQTEILREFNEMGRHDPPPGSEIPPQFNSDSALKGDLLMRLRDSAGDCRGMRSLLHVFLEAFDDLSSSTRKNTAGIIARGFQSCWGKDWREVPLEDMRRFMGIYTLYRDVYREIPPPNQLEHLPFEIRHSLKDSWLSWLNFIKAVRPNRCGQRFRQNELRLMREACEVLSSIGDPSGLDRAAELLEAPLPELYRRAPIDYLSTLGDPRAFDFSFPPDEGEPCRMKSSIFRKLVSTTEDQFLRLLACRRHDFQHYEITPTLRSDWSRAVLRYFVIADDMRPNSGKVEKEIVQYFEKKHRRLIYAGQAAFTTAYLEVLAHQFEDAEAAEQLETVVTLLARRPAWDGTEDLIRWTQRRTASTAPGVSAKEAEALGIKLPRKKHVDPVAKAAAGGLVRRVLVPENRAAVREAIDVLPDEARSTISLAVALTLDREIHIPLGDPRRGIFCGTGLPREPQWRHFSEKMDLPHPGRFEVFAGNHGRELFILLRDLQNPEYKARIFPFLKIPEADRAFLASVADGDPSAARIAWQLRMEPPSQCLKHGLENAKRDETRAFLLLMSVNNGDKEAYEALKKLVVPSFAKGRKTTLSRFKMPLIEEAIRRKDIGFLEKLYETVGAEWVPPQPFRRESTPYWGLQLNAALLHIESGRFASLETLDYSDPKNRVSVLRLLTEVATPDIEALLKRLDPLLPKNEGFESERDLWLNALRTCSSPWCRQELVRWKQWKTLFLLDDPRAGNGGSYLESGRIEEAIEAGLERQVPDITPRAFSDSPLSTAKPRRFQYPGVERSMNTLARIWPALDRKRKNIAVELIMQHPEEISDAVYRRLLNDDGGYRLFALRLFARHPRRALLPDIGEISRTDRVPWCRRVAEDLLACPFSDFDLATRFECSLPFFR